MIYPVDGNAGHLASAKFFAANLLLAGVNGDPIEEILVNLHIRDFDLIFCQRECAPFSDSVKFANAMMTLSMLQRAQVVLPLGTDDEIAALLDSEGLRKAP